MGLFFMKQRLPILFMVCVSVLAAGVVGTHSFFSRGGVLPIGILSPMYTPWLQKKGINRADLYLEWDKIPGRPWVVMLKEVEWTGGSAERARLRLGWTGSGIALQHVDIDGVDLDLGVMAKNPSKDGGSAALLSILLNTHGHIKRISLGGMGGLMPLLKTRIEKGEQAHVQPAASVRPRVQPSTQSHVPGSSKNTMADALLPTIDLYWDHGVVDIALSRHRSPENEEKNRHGKGVHRNFSGKVEKNIEHNVGINVFRDSAVQVPARDSAGVRNQAKNPTRNQAKNGVHSWARAEIHPTAAGGKWRFSWDPVVWHLEPLGIQNMQFSGSGSGVWKNKATGSPCPHQQSAGRSCTESCAGAPCPEHSPSPHLTGTQWSADMNIQQLGSAHIPGTVLESEAAGATPSAKTAAPAAGIPSGTPSPISSAFGFMPTVLGMTHGSEQAPPTLLEPQKASNAPQSVQKKGRSNLEHQGKKGVKPMGCIVSKTRIQGKFSNTQLCHVVFTSTIGDADISGQYTYNGSGQSIQSKGKKPRTSRGPEWTASVRMDRGRIAVSQLHHLWPLMPSSLGARTWVLENFYDGFLCNGRVFLEKNPGISNPKSVNIANPVQIHGGFSIQDTSLSFMSDMPRIQKMQVSTVFDANRFDIAVEKGQFEQHAVTGNLRIKMDQTPTMLELDMHLSGPLTRLLPILLRFSNATDLNIRNPTGQGKTHIYGHIPLITDVSMKDIVLNLHSEIPMAGFDFPIGSYWAQIRNTRLIMDYKDKKIDIQATGQINSLPITWSFKDAILRFSGQPTSDQISACIGKYWAVYVKNSPKIHGAYTNGVLNVHMDLTPCACTIPWIYWSKAPCDPLQVVFKKTDTQTSCTVNGAAMNVMLTADHGPKDSGIFGDMRIGKTVCTYRYTPISPGAYAGGDARINPGGDAGGHIGKSAVQCAVQSPRRSTGPSAAGFIRIKKPINLMDLWQACLKSGHHQLFFRSPSVHLLDLLDGGDLKKNSESVGIAEKTGSVAPDSGRVGIDLDVACQQLHTKHIEMDQVHVQLSGTAPTLLPSGKSALTHYVWKNGLVHSTHTAQKVKRQKTGLVSISWDALGKNKTRIMADVVDLGAAANGLGITQRIRGGDLRLQAIQDEKGVYTGSIYIDHIKTKFGALGKLLSVISPTMFTEMFSSGVTFSELDADFRYAPGVLKIMNGMGKGVNLGLFIKGSVFTQPGRFKLDGVAVPSYLINTFFSKFPVIGWFLGGAKGLISSEFSVTGPWGDPKVSVVPFSLFKIGFLKNIPFFKGAKKSRKKARAAAVSKGLEGVSSRGLYAGANVGDKDGGKGAANGAANGVEKNAKDSAIAKK